MKKTISTLEQLHSLRHRALKEASAKLNHQHQICERYSKNISALSMLVDEVREEDGNSAVFMVNYSGYKHTIQRVIDWQKQEQALATLEAHNLQKVVLKEAIREKSLGTILDKRRYELRVAHDRRDQKNIDAISVQCWLRQKIVHR